MPTPEEVLTYYHEHEAEFRLPEQVEVNQILVPVSRRKRRGQRPLAAPISRPGRKSRTRLEEKQTHDVA